MLSRPVNKWLYSGLNPPLLRGLTSFSAPRLRRRVQQNAGQIPAQEVSSQLSKCDDEQSHSTGILVRGYALAVAVGTLFDLSRIAQSVGVNVFLDSGRPKFVHRDVLHFTLKTRENDSVKNTIDRTPMSISTEAFIFADGCFVLWGSQSKILEKSLRLSKVLEPFCASSSPDIQKFSSQITEGLGSNIDEDCSIPFFESERTEFLPFEYHSGDRTGAVLRGETILLEGRVGCVFSGISNENSFDFDPSKIKDDYQSDNPSRLESPSKVSQKIRDMEHNHPSDSGLKSQNHHCFGTEDCLPESSFVSGNEFHVPSSDESGSLIRNHSSNQGPIIQETADESIPHDLFDHRLRLLRTMVALSDALVDSVKLARLEHRIERHAERTRQIPSLLASGGRLPLSRAKVLQMTGELLELRADLNLHSELSETPDLYWAEPELGSLYDRIAKCLELRRRVHVLNRKLDCAGELVALLRLHLSERHGLKLEWGIITLIAVEVAFELIHYFQF